MRALICLAGVVLAMVCGNVSYAERQVQVTVSVIDAAGQPVVDCPIHVASRSWSMYGGETWAARSDADGIAVLRPIVGETETHLLYQLAFRMGPRPSGEDQWEDVGQWHDDVLEVADLYSVPRPAVIDISDGATAYEATLQLRERIAVDVSAFGPDGERVAELGLASVEFLAGHQGESLIDPVRIEGVPKSTESHLVVYGGPPFFMMPSVVRLDAANTSGASTTVTTDLRAVPEGTVAVLVELTKSKPMIYHRVRGKRNITIISEDATIVCTLYLAGDESDNLYTVFELDADGMVEERIPLLPAGRYAIAPGQLSYPAAFILFMFMQGGRDPFTELEPLVVVEDGPPVKRELDLVAIEEAIVRLTGL